MDLRFDLLSIVILLYSYSSEEFQNFPPGNQLFARAPDDLLHGDSETTPAPPQPPEVHPTGLDGRTSDTPAGEAANQDCVGVNRRVHMMRVHSNKRA